MACRRDETGALAKEGPSILRTAVGWLNESRRTPHQSGKLALDEAKIECLFVTPDKAEGYHDRISYHDYAISPEIFHWQTRNNAGPDTPAGRRYIESPETAGASSSSSGKARKLRIAPSGREPRFT
jgi:hypothetical protein